MMAWSSLDAAEIYRPMYNCNNKVMLRQEYLTGLKGSTHDPFDPKFNSSSWISPIGSSGLLFRKAWFYQVGNYSFLTYRVIAAVPRGWFVSSTAKNWYDSSNMRVQLWWIQKVLCACSPVPFGRGHQKGNLVIGKRRSNSKDQLLDRNPNK